VETSEKTIDGASLGFGASVINAISRAIPEERATELISKPHLLKILLAPLLHEDVVELLTPLLLLQQGVPFYNRARIAWFEKSAIPNREKTTFRPSAMIEFAASKKFAFLSEERAKHLCKLVSSFGRRIGPMCHFFFKDSQGLHAWMSYESGVEMNVLDYPDLEKEYVGYNGNVFFFEQANSEGTNICAA